MEYLNSIKKALFIFIIFLILSYLVPRISLFEDTGIILTVGTFLFAIFSGFYISRLNTRYNGIIKAIANEDAAWINLYETSKLLGKDFLAKIADIIDERYIIAYDHPLTFDYKESGKQVSKIYDFLNELNTKRNFKREQGLSEILDILEIIESERNNQSVSGVEKLGRGQWTITVLLACIILISLFMLRDDSLYSPLIIALLSTATVMVLFIIKDLQDLKIIEGTLQVSESGQEIFDHIGRPRYFNKNNLQVGNIKIPDDKDEYRLGLHKPGESKNIVFMKKNDKGIFEKVE